MCCCINVELTDELHIYLSGIGNPMKVLHECAEGIHLRSGGGYRMPIRN
jgi:hypothetical protein